MGTFLLFPIPLRQLPRDADLDVDSGALPRIDSHAAARAARPSLDADQAEAPVAAPPVTDGLVAEFTVAMLGRKSHALPAIAYLKENVVPRGSQTHPDLQRSRVARHV